MKVEIGTKFKIGFKAKKHNNQFIWREGMWTEGCGIWTTKNGKLVFTYYDIVMNGFRTATNGWILKQFDNKELN